MRLLDLILPTPAENLALDEALLDPRQPETLRLWEAPAPMVVLGRSSRAAVEVDAEACRRAGAPVLRRASGGATIVAGPGCLMHAVTLDTRGRPDLDGVDAVHRFVLGRLVAALRPLVVSVTSAGTSDLAFAPTPTAPLMKFSGNSLRLVRQRVLYHGTLLYAFDTSVVSQLLRTPPRQPDYRAGRAHEAFVANLPTTAAMLRAALIAAWNATPAEAGPELLDATRGLVAGRYGREDWSLAR